MCCLVQCSYGQPYSCTRFCCHCKFTLSETPLAPSLCVNVFHTPTSFPFVSFRKHWIFAYSSFTSSLFLPACYITYTLKSLTGKKLNINLPVFFWVKCKMKYSRTSQGCTSAGFYGNCRAVFSAVVSLRLTLCFQPGEEGRVRTDPKGAKQKVGQHHHRQAKSFSLRRDHVMNSLPCFRKTWCWQKAHTIKHQQSQSHRQRCKRLHLSVDTNTNFCPFIKKASFLLWWTNDWQLLCFQHV